MGPFAQTSDHEEENGFLALAAELQDRTNAIRRNSTSPLSLSLVSTGEEDSRFIPR